MKTYNMFIETTQITHAITFTTSVCGKKPLYVVDRLF